MSFLGLPVDVSIRNYDFPIGISFYTFLTIGYLIDVYRRDHLAETSTGTFALYILFFPKLLAGPIERSRNLLTQLHEQKNFDYTKVTSGMKLIAWGLYKKTVIANSSPKVILVGGSNVAFGLDSEIIQHQLEVPVVNMGLHVGSVCIICLRKSGRS